MSVLLIYALSGHIRSKNIVQSRHKALNLSFTGIMHKTHPQHTDLRIHACSLLKGALLKIIPRLASPQAARSWIISTSDLSVSTATVGARVYASLGPRRFIEFLF